ncbi:MAG: InlB B-repeat-containing protein, partial [Oscillospiraceae bacterium]|nr:InlB B-repeat-containing protein [Oscillospiraceae bacterium]
RVFAVLLCTALLLGLLPAAAFAASCTDPACGHLAAIGGEHYDTVHEALEAAVDGDTVTVLKSHTITLDGSYTDTYAVDGYTVLFVVSGRAVTVDFNGCMITCDLQTAYSGLGLMSCFVSRGGAALTLKDSSAAQSGGIELKTNGNAAYSLLCNYEESASLTIESGRYICDNISTGDAMLYCTGNERLYIRGGYFYLDNVGQRDSATQVPWIINVNKNNERHAIVTGGTFNSDINHQFRPFEVDMPKELALRNNGDGTYTIVDASVYTQETEFSGRWYGHPVGYTLLKEAVAAVRPIRKESGQTSPAEYVVLLETCDVDETLIIDEDMEIRLEGYTVNWTGADGQPILTVKAGKTLTIDPAFLPTKEGNTCIDLFTDAALTVPADLSGGTLGYAEATEDISLYAKWELNEYTVTYTDGVGGSVFADVETTLFYGQATPAFGADPVRAGYTFMGWSPAVSATVGAGDVTYTAQWQLIPPTPTRTNPSTGVKLAAAAR